MLTLMPCAKLVSSSCFWLQTMQGPSVILYSVSWSNIPSGICNWLHTFLCFEFQILGGTMQHPVSQLSREWKQTLKDKNLCNASRKAATFWISWNGWLCERARWIKSWALIGYTIGQDEAVMPAQDCPPCSCKKKIFLNAGSPRFPFPISTKYVLRDRSFFMRWGGGGWWDLRRAPLSLVVTASVIMQTTVPGGQK